MYSKEEASQLTQQFWISFGQYMKPVPSAEGLAMNWVNYKTGVKNISFKMYTGGNKATIAIQLSHSDFEIRHLIFEQLQEFKVIFRNTMDEDWFWEKDVIDEHGKTLSLVSITLTDKSIFNRQHWPALISFFKPRIIALDNFWTDVKPIFEDLV